MIGGNRVVDGRTSSPPSSYREINASDSDDAYDNKSNNND